MPIARRPATRLNHISVVNSGRERFDLEEDIGMRLIAKQLKWTVARLFPLPELNVPLK